MAHGESRYPDSADAIASFSIVGGFGRSFGKFCVLPPPGWTRIDGDAASASEP